MARLQTDTRKQDTRQKIQLGGLVAKAGLAEEESAVLLGAFMAIFTELAGPEGHSVRRRYQRLGDQIFTAEKR